MCDRCWQSAHNINHLMFWCKDGELAVLPRLKSYLSDCSELLSDNIFFLLPVCQQSRKPVLDLVIDVLLLLLLLLLLLIMLLMSLLLCVFLYLFICLLLLLRRRPTAFPYNRK